MPPEVRAAQSPQSLRLIAGALVDLGAEVKAASETMEAHGFKELEITHFKSLSLGMKQLSGFVRAVRDAVHDAQFARGDFGDRKGEEPTKQKRKKRA